MDRSLGLSIHDVCLRCSTSSQCGDRDVVSCANVMSQARLYRLADIHEESPYESHCPGNKYAPDYLHTQSKRFEHINSNTVFANER